MPNDSVFQPRSEPQVISVTELNQSVARLLERSIPLCWISGEVSNFVRAGSGHWYFTLKDTQAQVRAVMFKSRSLAADFMPREGDKIEVRATVGLYAPRGDYQLNVEAIRRAGLGNLYEAFLQLKNKLSQAGLFDAQRKQSLPPFPRRVGIVTSPQAAALRDILITLQRRAPHVHIVIYPTLVQGNGAAQKIAQAIDNAIARNECDVLVVARGGGSIEDLWAFNDEQLAYTIARCPIPVITGIGHETDFTIADFVADLRAPTPTAAAEMAVAARSDLLLQVEKNCNQLRRAWRRRFDQEQQTLDHLSHRLINPLAYIRAERSRLDNLHLQFRHSAHNARKQATFEFAQLKQRLQTCAPDSTIQKKQLKSDAQKMQSLTRHQLDLRQNRLKNLRAQLELLNPQRTLERGYAIVMDQHHTVLQSPSQINAPTNLKLRLAKGEVDLEVSAAHPKSN